MESRLAIETALVRAAFDGHDAVHRITSQVTASDFKDMPMRRVFSELCRLTDSGTPLDPVLVVQGLVTNSTVPDGVALQTVVDLSGAHWESAHIDHYCRTLRKYTSTAALRMIGLQLAAEDSIDEAAIESFEPLSVSVAGGSSIRAAAVTVGCSEQTAYNLSASQEFRQRVFELRASMTAEAVGRLTACCSEAVTTLQELLSSTNEPAVRLNAAKAILNTLGPLSEANEIRQRLMALELQTRPFLKVH